MCSGTIPWEGEPGSCRKTVFFKYCPHAVAWGPCYYNADDYPGAPPFPGPCGRLHLPAQLARCSGAGLSANQRAMLLPPSAFGVHSQTANKNHAEAVWRRAQDDRVELVALRAELEAMRAAAPAATTGAKL